MTEPITFFVAREIVTMNPSNPRGTHVAARAGRILGVGSYDEVAGPFDSDADLTMGVTHAPYLRILDGMADDGADVILAGHTHGGQLCIAIVGALVTNCDIDRKRAKGLSSHGDSVLHVSAGLGTSPYAPVRFACPPEATLITLSARD